MNSTPYKIDLSDIRNYKTTYKNDYTKKKIKKINLKNNLINLIRLPQRYIDYMINSKLKIKKNKIYCV